MLGGGILGDECDNDEIRAEGPFAGSCEEGELVVGNETGSEVKDAVFEAPRVARVELRDESLAVAVLIGAGPSIKSEHEGPAQDIP